jgi:hypothetical protein
MSVKLSGRLPRDDRNGIASIATALVNDPSAVHVIVALVDCRKITTDIETSEVMPECRIRAIEAFPGATADGEELRRLWRRARERRTGEMELELPIELERELDALRPAPAEDGDQDGSAS